MPNTSYTPTPQTRCVNLDWLEVHCLEPFGQPRTADYFRSVGLVVVERPYGTRVYKEMFTIQDDAGQPFLEVRRNPASQLPDGIHLPEECHLRLTNYACYHDDAAQLLQEFIEHFGYTFTRITRVDICLDFEYFDYGDDPQSFLSRYLKHRYSKINQGNIHAHGADRWNGQEWNSLSWGAPSSDIGTKFYNKTMELFDPSSGSYKKPYIRYAWFQCGLIDDFVANTKLKDGVPYTPQIWRVEFSIRSSVKNWFVIELNGNSKAYQSIRNTLQSYMGRERLLTLFASLAQHYFHFKYFVEGQRKDRCPDKKLFNFTGQQYLYTVGRDNGIGAGNSGIRPLLSLINKLKHYRDTHIGVDIHRACSILIEAMESDTLRADMSHPWSVEELKALQLALSSKASGNKSDIAILLNEIKAFLHINDNTAIF